MYKRNLRLQLNDWVVCRRDPNRGPFLKPSSRLLSRKQRGIMTDLHVLYVKITPAPPTASVSDALSPLTAWPLSLVQEPVFFSPNASPQSAAFKCWIVGRDTVFPTISRQPARSTLRPCDCFESLGRTRLTQVEPRRHLPPPTSPSSVMTPFHSILSLKTDKALPVSTFSTLLPPQCG